MASPQTPTQVVAVGDASQSDPSFLLMVMAVIFIGIGAWIALRGSHDNSGDAMERTDRIPQLYGYSVCLIAVIVALMSINTIVEKIFTLQDPIAASSPSYPFANTPLTSFEAYKAANDRPGPSPRPDSAIKLTDAQLRARYEALRADQVQRTSLDARRELAKSVILLLVAVGLFWWHWRWVRGR
jgi:hypothetical protein